MALTKCLARAMCLEFRKGLARGVGLALIWRGENGNVNGVDKKEKKQEPEQRLEKHLCPQAKKGEEPVKGTEQRSWRQKRKPQHVEKSKEESQRSQKRMTVIRKDDIPSTLWAVNHLASS